VAARGPERSRDLRDYAYFVYCYCVIVLQYYFALSIRSFKSQFCMTFLTNRDVGVTELSGFVTIYTVTKIDTVMPCIAPTPYTCNTY